MSAWTLALGVLPSSMFPPLWGSPLVIPCGMNATGKFTEHLELASFAPVSVHRSGSAPDL